MDYTFWFPQWFEKIFISTVELVIPTGAQTNEANAEIEAQPVIVEAKKALVQHNLDTYMSSYTFTH